MAKAVFSSQSDSSFFLMALVFTSSSSLALDRILPPSTSLIEVQNAHTYSSLKILVLPAARLRPENKIALINSALILAQSRGIVKEEYREMCNFPHFVVNMHKPDNK